MPNLRFNKCPSAQLLVQQFKHRVQQEAPPVSNIYQCDAPQPVRAIPEYAPMGGVLIAYPGILPPPTGHSQQTPRGKRSFGIPNELIVRMQQNESSDPVHILVMCDDTNANAEIDAALSATAASLGLTYNANHLHLIPWDTDTFWTRDYSPWWVRNTVTESYAIAKHVYTTLGGGSVGLAEGAENVDPRVGLGIFRLNDDYGADAISDYLNAPIRAWNAAAWGKAPDQVLLPTLPTHDWYFTGVLDVGGIFMVTGNNKIASSYLVATQNELPVLNEGENTDPDIHEIDRRMTYILEQFNRFMGAKSYHVLSDPTGTYIGHIDCWGKFLADDKVLIAQSQDPAVNKGFDQIANSFAEDGFKVFRVMVQRMYIAQADGGATTAAYTNSLILNNCVYVPIAGPGYETFDQQALAVYQQALIDYKVFGIPSKPEFPWLGTDAMHCRAFGVPRDVINTWLASQRPAAPPVLK